MQVAEAGIRNRLLRAPLPLAPHVPMSGIVCLTVPLALQSISEGTTRRSAAFQSTATYAVTAGPDLK